MSPTARHQRSRSRPASENLQVDPAVLQSLSLPQLRDICQSNGLLATGNRATLNRRLHDAGITLDGLRNASSDPSQQNNSEIQNEGDNTFSDGQLAHIRRLVKRNCLCSDQGDCRRSGESRRQRCAGSTSSSTSPALCKCRRHFAFVTARPSNFVTARPTNTRGLNVP